MMIGNNRRSTRLRTTTAVDELELPTKLPNKEHNNIAGAAEKSTIAVETSNTDTNTNSNSTTSTIFEDRQFEFEGKIYDTYQDMVNAKRKRNEEYLKQNGLWKIGEKMRQERTTATNNNNNNNKGLKKRKVTAVEATTNNPTRRKSNRLAGTPSDGRFVQEERGGAFVIAAANTTLLKNTDGSNAMTTERAADAATEIGVSLNLEEAMHLCDAKWVHESSVNDAKTFCTEILQASALQQETNLIKTTSTAKDINNNSNNNNKARDKSPTSVMVTTNNNKNRSDDDDSKSMTMIQTQIDALSLDNEDMVAKVTPNRIYSVAVHPSKNHLVVCAGDKNGYVGLWNVNHHNSSAATAAATATATDATTEHAATASDGRNAMDGVYLFRPHTGPVSMLNWIKGGAGMISSSYDGTVRYFDVEHERFDQVFAINYDEYSDKFYTQYLELDHRSATQDAFFLSTSIGSVLHIDRRMGGALAVRSSRTNSIIGDSNGSGGGGGGGVTFHASLSDKKINSVSLHRDGYCLATAGLDRTVKFWDLRKFGGPKSGSKRSSSSLSTSLEPTEPKGALLGEHFNTLSVNSAIFSPSGEYMVATNMNNVLNVYHQAHLKVTASTGKNAGTTIVKPKYAIRHDNQTGRWLSTFMANWHPELDIFCVGSKDKPRAMDIFDGATGEHLRAVKGEALTAVASRCAFHPSANKIILVGGNSSGRVTVAQ